MQMLRTLFWVVTAVVIVLFSMWNWSPVSVKIWPGMGASQGLRLDTFLPLLILGAYALGMIPLWLMYRASKWNFTRRLENAERQLADLRAQQAAASGTAFTGNPLPTTVPTVETPL